MVSPDQSPEWDFSPAIKVLHSLYSQNAKSQPPSFDAPVTGLSYSSPELDGQLQDRPQGLGNFDRVWQFLELPLDAPVPGMDHVPDKDDCPELVTGTSPLEDTTFGCIGLHDEYDNGNGEENAKFGLEFMSQKITKKNMREKVVVERTTATSVTTRVESEDELKQLQSADRRAIIHDMLYGSTPPKSIPSPQVSILQRPIPFSLRTPERIPYSPLLVPGLFAYNPIEWQIPHNEIRRRALLLDRLMQDFPQEREQLIYHRQSVGFAFNQSNTCFIGIHVFVDVSNILIGFHDALKLACNVPIAQRIRRVPISFTNLSLILERGRPTVKRILAGSDQFPHVAEAKALGYETNILARVFKAKPSPRQRRFISGTSSGSETAEGAGYGRASMTFPGPEKRVEQGVDEILHLKMLESILDAGDSPSTIVLATGDAAEAEYSGGFLRMIERALEHGWRVELYSFKRNTSSAYRRAEFRERWGWRFNMIQLDPYLEGLVGHE